MGNGPRYRVKLKRRRQGRTNYYKRRDLLKSGKLRVVIRKSTKHITIQFVEAKADGDITLSASTSQHLIAYGWNISGGNIPASYLAGYLAGKKAVKSGITEGILDLGLQANAYGGRIYSALKGVVDAGIDVPVNESIFPEEVIYKGEHIKKKAQWLKEEDKDLYKRIYSRYTSNKVDPTKLDALVKKVVTAIDKEY
jgi:large subunit ribosomal protein L18